MKTDTSSWWYCDNIIDHPDSIGLLRMDFPRAFILVRNYGDIYPSDNFEYFKECVAEVNFLDPKDRDGADIDGILTDAWNFLALEEQEEENLDEEYEE